MKIEKFTLSNDAQIFGILKKGYSEPYEYEGPYGSIHNEYYEDDGSDHGVFLHNENGPAYISGSGNKFHYQNDLLHREDGPAVEYIGGCYKWYWKGKLHREDGPAIKDVFENEEYYFHGMRHNDKGPAFISKNGEKSFYLYDKRYSEEGWMEQVTAP